MFFQENKNKSKTRLGKAHINNTPLDPKVGYVLVGEILRAS